MPTVENFTPTVFWTTIYGMLALCILFMIVYKVYDAVVTIVERRKKKKESEKSFLLIAFSICQYLAITRQKDAISALLDMVEPY